MWQMRVFSVILLYYVELKGNFDGCDTCHVNIKGTDYCITMLPQYVCIMLHLEK